MGYDSCSTVPGVYDSKQTESEAATLPGVYSSNQTSSSGYALGVSLFTAINPWHCAISITHTHTHTQLCMYVLYLLYITLYVNYETVLCMLCIDRFPQAFTWTDVEMYVPRTLFVG